MESRWYLPPGTTLETTRIEDRGHALHVTPKAWQKITSHLDRKRLMQEAIDKEEAHKQALKEGSEAMTKSWDNSLENIRIRKEQDRLKRLEEAEETKMRNFYAIREEQAIVRDKFLQDSKKSMYISKGYPRELSLSLVESGILYERGKQLEMNAFLLKHERGEEEKFAESVKEGARQEKLDNLEKAKEQKRKQLENRAILLRDIHERAETERKAKEKQIKEEREDIASAARENDFIKKLLKETDQERRDKVKEEVKKFTQQQEELAQLKKQEERETNEVIDIYIGAKHKIECLRKKKEREMQEAFQLRVAAAARVVIAAAQSKSSDEERILKKAQDEREQQEQEKMEAKKAENDRLVKERKETYEAFLKEEARRNKIKQEEEKWEMLNRLKANDVMTKYEADKKQKAFDDKIAYRKALFEQMDENEKRRQKLKDTEDANLKAKLDGFAKDDEQFEKYAEEVKEYAKEKGWNQLPIRKVIKAYRKENKIPFETCYPCANYEMRPKAGTENTGKH